MSATDYLLTYAVSLMLLVVADAFWLGKISPQLYKQNIGHLMAKKPNLKAAGVFYATYLAGLVYLVIKPALDQESSSVMLLNAAVYGLACYATFDLTSQAVFKAWPTKITAIDLAWGTFLTVVVATGTYLVAINFLTA